MCPGKNAADEEKGTVTDVPLRLLLAYDGSGHAQAAVKLISDLPLGRNTKVTLIAVLPTQHIGAHEDLHSRLNKIVEDFENKGVEVESVLRAGNPAATINEYARWNDINLTIIGAKGLRSTFGILLGGVAQQVVEYSCCPVLVVREPFQRVRRILVLTDGSQYSHEAVLYLTPRVNLDRPRFPIPSQAKVSVMHVLPPPITPDMMSRSWTVGPEVLFPVPPAELDINALERREAEEGRRVLEQAANIMAERGVEAESILMRGDAATEIIKHIKENDVDLVVAGSRGLSAVTGWLLGSVSRKLVHYAGCSTLIVKQVEA
jgi:nucleotide-binding universal stress UspA family protein